MAFSLRHLHSALELERAVLGEESKVVCVRVGQDFHPDCMRMDEVLGGAAREVEAACSVYAVDVREVPECVAEFQLAEPAALVFFFRGKALQLDLGAGGQRRFAQPLEGQQAFVSLVEAVCRGAQQGREVITAPRDYSLQFGY